MPECSANATRSEMRDGMRVDWDVPIPVDDGTVLRADVFRPIQEGRYPVLLSYGPYAKGLAFQDGYPSAWKRMVDASIPDVAGGLLQPVPELGGGGSGEMGARRLRLRARRFARRRALAGLHRPFLAARDAGLLRLHRVGRRAALVQRQGRAQRHFLLRHEPVARRRAAAAASRGDVRLGGRGRLVPRRDASRRHPLHLLGELVRHAGEDRAARPRRARPAQPRHGRAGLRAARRCPTRELAANRCDFGDDILAHPLDDDYHRARSPDWAQDHGAVPFRGQLGRPGAAPARQLRGLRPRGVEGEVARGARHRALDALLHRLRPRPAEAVLRPFPEGRGQRLGRQPRVQLQVRHPDRFVERAREGMAARAHALDVFYLDVATGALGEAEAQGGEASFDALGDGLTFCRAPLPGARDHRAARGELRLFLDRATRTCSSCCASSRRTCAR